LEESAKAIRNVKKNPDRLSIGYFSGTFTHDEDFAELTKALIKIMNKYENIDLILGGHITLPSQFKRFKAMNRIITLPFVPWEKLPYNLAKVDINIAPLVINEFAQCKSELKYFESAILYLPTVASPTMPFMNAITNGYNGFLARTEDEWHEAFQSLINDNEKRKSIGENAYKHAITNYSPEAMSEKVINTYKMILEENS
jgi:glycosyltransferase involved in cell wall biosynthesis